MAEAGAGAGKEDRMKIEKLRTENRIHPLAVDRKRPFFGWNVSGEEREIYQEALRIRVWREKPPCGTASADREREPAGEPVWDSGRISSGRMEISYEGEPLLSGSRYYWSVEADFRYVTEEGRTEHTTLTELSWFETGFFHREDWKGSFIGETRDREYHLYRKCFSCSRKIYRARLYVCCPGHFEFYLNGRRVSDHVLEPGWSDYRKTCFYTAYDVTRLLDQGENAALVKLGDGMYNVPGGRYVYYERSYGKAEFLARLELIYCDGSRETVVTDESWSRAQSPVTFCCIYGGEDFDGRLWKKEYLLPGYTEDASWERAVQVPEPEGKLRAVPMEPLRVMRTYRPVRVTENSPGVWLYDLGCNFSGWVRLRVRTDGSCAGQRIVMTPGELLDENNSPDQRVTGRGYRWTYILNDDEVQEFAPDFTYTGFRYVEVTGARPKEGTGEEKAFCLGEGAAEQGKVPCLWENGGGSNGFECESCSMPVIELLEGQFLYPDAEQAGDFICSNELFNDIHRIVVQAVLSNTKSYFTDCPHREKLAWLEQTHLIGPSIMYNLDVKNLCAKIEGDMSDAQRENGLVPDICPEYVAGFDKYHKGFVDSPEWGSACILVPWYLYRRYGDSSVMERYYPVMKRYLEYLRSRTHHELLHHGLGDWLDIGPCTPHSQNTPVPVTATCVYYSDLSVMSKAARLLGMEEDAREWEETMERVYREYNLQFLDDQTGRYGTGSQAAQAMSLMVGLVPPEYEEKAVGQLREDVEKRGYAVTAGDVGHPYLIAALMKYGLNEQLNKMTNITSAPGYGYQVVNGATTLTEEWDGPDPARPHGSQNHLMLGSIEEWFYGGLAGVDLIRNELPFGEIRIAPQPVENLEFVRAWVKHPCGRIEVEWKREGELVKVGVTVPPNVTAHLESPDGSVRRSVGSGRHWYSFPVPG